MQNLNGEAYNCLMTQYKQELSSQWIRDNLSLNVESWSGARPQWYPGMQADLGMSRVRSIPKKVAKNN